MNLPKWFLPVQNELDVSKTNYFGTKEGQGMRLEVNVSNSESCLKKKYYVRILKYELGG